MTQRPVTYTKKQIEKYDIRGGRVSYAFITLDDEAGDINIQSDWGSYSYIWSSRGRDTPLKEFLLSCDDDYVMNKFSYNDDGRNHFYSGESEKELRREIFRHRRDGEIDKELARNAYDEIRYIDFHNIHTYGESLSISTHLVKAFPCWAENGTGIVTGYSPQLKCFMQHVWGEFMRILKEERDGKERTG